MKIDITTPIEIDSFNSRMTEPEVGEDVEVIETAYCPLCGIGENHKDIKICKDCEDVFSPENQVWSAYWRAERAMAKLKKIEI
jgi:hypothetical protein